MARKIRARTRTSRGKRRVGRPSRGPTMQLVTRLSKDLADAIERLRKAEAKAETRTQVVDRLLRKGLGWTK